MGLWHWVVSGGWKDLEEMTNKNLTSFKGTVRASWVALQAHSSVSSPSCSSRSMSLPGKKWSFISSPLEMGQAQLGLMEEGNTNMATVLQPLQGRGRERRMHWLIYQFSK